MIRTYARLVKLTDDGPVRLITYPPCACKNWNGEPGGICKSCGLAIPDQKEMRYNSIMWTFENVISQIEKKDNE